MTFLRSLVSSKPDIDPYEKEVLCGLDFKSSDPADAQAIEELKNEQKELAQELADFYRFGSANYAPNILKANQYRKKAGLPPFPSSATEADEDGVYQETTGATLADWAQYLHGWFSTFRLWLLRFNRFYSQFKSPFLPNFYNIFGLSYAVDLVIDLSIVIEAVFFAPLAPHEKNWSWLRIGLVRLKNILLEDQRLFNMVNNVLWLTINVTVFFVSPQTAIILNMCGFGGDTFVDMAKGFRELWRSCKLLWKARQKRQQLEEDLSSIAEENRTPEQISELKQLRLIESSLKWKVGGLLLKHGSQLIGTVLIFVGMALFWGFPPLAPASQVIMTIGAGLVSGASTLHLFKKVYLSAPGWIKTTTNVATKIAGWFNRVVLGNKPTVEVTPPENNIAQAAPVNNVAQPVLVGIENIPPRKVSNAKDIPQPSQPVYSGSEHSVYSGSEHSFKDSLPKSGSYQSPNPCTSTAIVTERLQQTQPRPIIRKATNSVSSSPIAQKSLQPPITVTSTSFKQHMLLVPVSKKTGQPSSCPAHLPLKNPQKNQFTG